MTVQESVYELLDEAASKNSAIPSLRMLRAKIGAGSLTTISEAVKRWRMSRLVASGELPEALTNEQAGVIAQAVWGVVSPMLESRMTALKGKTEQIIAIEKEETDKLVRAADEDLVKLNSVLVDKHYLEDQVGKLEGRIAELEKELATTQTALESSRRELDLIQKNHESGQAACIEMMENANRIIETLTARLPPIDEPEKMKEEQPRSGLLL